MNSGRRNLSFKDFGQREREKISESKRPTEILDSRRASFFDYRGVIFATLDEWMRHYCELFKATFCRFDMVFMPSK